MFPKKIYQHPQQHAGYFVPQLAGGNGTYDRTDQASVALTRPANGGGISQPRTGTWSCLRDGRGPEEVKRRLGAKVALQYHHRKPSLGLRAQPPTPERERSLTVKETNEPKGFPAMPFEPLTRPASRLTKA